MHILVVDIGGTNVKVWKTGESDKVKIPSGPELTPQAMVDAIRKEAGDWKFDRVSIGYPGDIKHGKPVANPYALAPGWIDFNYGDAFGCPTRLMNDACMQALGSYEGGSMLYIGLGTNMGTSLIVDRKIVPLALGHVQVRKKIFNEYLSREGRERMGASEWQDAVYEAAEVLKHAFLVDYVTLGGGNAKKLENLPGFCRRGGNQNAYFGGLRMWEDAAHAGN
ncbi:MAG: ROK family protein [Planctomycetaceae bacterium]|nr:ROK family protein [Planctomycetaceae bacterium]